MGSSEWVRLEYMDVFICCSKRAFGSAAMGSSEWLRLGCMDVYMCCSKRAVGSAAMGSSEWLRLEYTDVFICCSKRAFGSAAMGSREWLPGVTSKSTTIVRGFHIYTIVVVHYKLESSAQRSFSSMPSTELESVKVGLQSAQGGSK